MLPNPTFRLATSFFGLYIFGVSFSKLTDEFLKHREVTRCHTSLALLMDFVNALSRIRITILMDLFTEIGRNLQENNYGK